MIQYFQILFQSLLFKVLQIINFPQEFKFQDSLSIFNKNRWNIIRTFMLKHKKRKKRVKKKYRKIKKKRIFLNTQMNMFYQRKGNLKKLLHWGMIIHNIFLSLN